MIDWCVEVRMLLLQFCGLRNWKVEIGRGLCVKYANEVFCCIIILQAPNFALLSPWLKVRGEVVNPNSYPNFEYVFMCLHGNAMSIVACTGVSWN